ECTRQWNYEPDKPIYTPRVHGRIITPMAHAELGIILRGEDDSAVRKEFKVGWGQYRDRGEAHFVSTYLGDRQDVRSFDRDPLTFPVESKDAKSLCEEIGEMLQPDLRVGVAAVIMDKERRFESAILNYRE
ncbi:hypothetical protein KY363_07495, partial [Candidatus Woesearchaeota archaeon]|nr:hypothetical protein [Candidatus Woesearchaeota archaeon]